MAKYNFAGGGQILVGPYSDATSGIHQIEDIYQFALDEGFHANGFVPPIEELPEWEHALILQDDIEEWLNENRCPPYCYWGNSEHGGDWGLWPQNWESLEEALLEGFIKSVDDPGDVPNVGYAIFVNDHGNVTFYEDGKEVWSCV